MQKPEASGTPTYRGSSKHKNRPTGEQKGTFCPEWTHATPEGGFGADAHEHAWSTTKAATLFAEASVDPKTGRRYATERGIAFEAKSTADGTWHGYPIPWESVPNAIRQTWMKDSKVLRGQIKRFFRFDRNNFLWPLETDLQ
jgi:hypothetical protein